MSWKLMIHGGCGAMRPDTVPPQQEEAARAGLEAALDAGEAILSTGGSALDAAIMDGATRRCGAVAGLQRTRAPVSAARAVMAHSPHVLLTYEGADLFAREQGLEQVANDWFVIPERRAQLDFVFGAGGGFDC
jgi:beta-aspartyl-peptidase (threonine type)